MFKKILFYILLILILPSSSFASVIYQMDWEGSNILDAPDGYSNLSQGADDYGAGALETVNPFAGSKCLKITWDRHAYSLRNSSYSWTASGLGDNSYYLRTSGGTTPLLNEPGYVKIGSALGVEGALGSLSAGQWAYGDSNGLGYDTLYVHIIGDGDPDAQAVDYIDTGRDGQLFSNDPSIYTACDFDLATPNVMGSVHEYYIGFAIKFDSGQTIFNPVGRKILYRTGASAQSLLFMGSKSYSGICGSDEENAAFYFKAPFGVDANNNMSNGEKIQLGGPKCNTSAGQDCDAWPGCEAAATGLVTADGNWHTIILYVKEHATAGRLTMWIDGNKMIDAYADAWDTTNGEAGGPCTTETFDTEHADFSGYKFPTYYNVGPFLTDQIEYYDNFIIATTLPEVQAYLAEDDDAPTLSSATITTSGQTSEINWSEAVTDGGVDSGDINLDCSTAGDNVVLTLVNGDGTNKWTLSHAQIYSDDTCTLDIEVAATEIVDASSNSLTGVTDQTISNGSQATLTGTTNKALGGTGGSALGGSGGSITGS